MWIAKNSITGQTYGRSFSSIYDCQSYIDKELIILEYLYQRICVIEKKVEEDSAFQDYLEEHYPDGCSAFESIFAHIQFALQPFMDDLEKSIHNSLFDEEIESLSEEEYSSNKVIRCYYVEQERFASGLDF